MKLFKLTLWTIASLTGVSLFVGGVGGALLLRHVERTYVEMQAYANAQGARRVSRLLEQQLAAGATPKELEHRLQTSLTHSPYDETGFLCLLDAKGTVLCHPDAKSVGMNMSHAPFYRLDNTRTSPVGEWFGKKKGGSGLLLDQDYGGKTQIVHSEPVRGTDWSVSVHSNAALVEERVNRLRRAIQRTAIPILIGFIAFGTLAARFVGRSYEHQIEAANMDLERRVSERTEELREAMARYRNLFESAPSAIFLRQQGGKLIDVNTKAEELTGFSRETLLTLSFDDLCEKVGDLPSSPMTVNSTVNGRHAWAGALTTNAASRHDVHVREVHVYESEIQEAQGDFCLEIVQDVTDQKLLEAELNQSRKMEAIGQLAGGVAHDFNNVLTAIMGFSELTRSAYPEDETIQRNLLEVINAGERAGNLTRQLLAFSRKQILQPKIVSFNDILSNLEKMLSRVIGEQVEIEAHYEPDLWPVRVDPGQIEQVVLNLAVNARDAMPEGGTLRIATSNFRQCDTNEGLASTSHCEDRVLLTVSDTGTGIPNEIRDRIFEPFFTTKETGKGTGLGLATVHGIVKQHGGDIEVDSAPGRGTTFRITFPTTEGAEDVSLDVQAKPLPRGSETILLVEDEPGVRQLGETILKDLGYKVLTAENARAALQVLASFDGAVAMMLTDVVMSGMSVKELVQRLGETHPKLKVAYMTGYTDDTIVDKGVLQEGVTLIHKPFSASTLAETVREVLDRGVHANGLH